MEVPVVKRHFTVKEYHQMAASDILTENDRVELINGEIITMSPIGSRHASCVKRINALLNSKLQQIAIISVQDPLHIGEYSEPEPDIAVLKPRADFYAQQHPTPQDTLLIIEVSETTLPYDREVKLPLYAEAGIVEVWIVNLAQACVEAYTHPSGDKYLEKKQYKKDSSVAVAGITVAVQDMLA